MSARKKARQNRTYTKFTGSLRVLFHVGSENIQVLLLPITAKIKRGKDSVKNIINCHINVSALLSQC